MHKIYMVEKCFVFGEKCTCLFSIDDMKTEEFQGNELYSSQEEADTRIMPYLKHASEESNEKAIIVHSPDTDVLILLLTYVQKLKSNKSVMFDTGVGIKRRLIRVHDIIQSREAEQTKALLGLYANIRDSAHLKHLDSKIKNTTKVIMQFKLWVDDCIGQAYWIKIRI